MKSTEYIWFGLAELLRLLEVENIVFHNINTPSCIYDILYYSYFLYLLFSRYTYKYS